MACAIAVAEAQPVHSFSVKIGIDCESVDSLGGRERVEYLIKDMAIRFRPYITPVPTTTASTRLLSRVLSMALSTSSVMRAVSPTSMP